MLLLDKLSLIRSNIFSEEQEFATHIKRWFPIAIIIGILVGIAMTLFTIFINLISIIMGFFPSLLAIAIGGLLVWILVLIKFEDPSVNGISYVIRKKLAKEPVPLTQTQEFVSAGITIGSGLPVGREGPALIIGSAIATTVSKWRKIPKNQLHEAITIGSAAATGALFQAPFGSAVFAAEVPYKEDSDEPLLMVSFLASVVAAITLRSLLSLLNFIGFEVNLYLFEIGYAFLQINVITSLLAFLLGMLIGIFGRSIIELYYKYQSIINNRFTPSNRILIGLSITFLSILIGHFTINDFYLSNGISAFEAIPMLIMPGNRALMSTLFIILIIQIIATIGIIAAGFPGGIFAPTLSIGAIFGIIFAMFFDFTLQSNLIAFAIIGMSASHAAFTKTPIASILLVLEITNLPNLIIPIILTNISAHIFSGHKSLYAGQIRSRDVNILKELSEYDQYSELKVQDVMTPKDQLIISYPEQKLVELSSICNEKSISTIPVEDKNGKISGVISFNDITKGIENGKLLVSEAMTHGAIAVPSNINLRETLVIILNNKIERAPVISEDNEIIGIISQSDILRGTSNLPKGINLL
ncbi:MAG: chloride channel protein [Candidatus Kariarchaeum pelagius]